MAINIIPIDTPPEIKEGEIVGIFIKPVGSDDYLPPSKYVRTLKGPTFTISIADLK